MLTRFHAILCAFFLLGALVHSDAQAIQIDNDLPTTTVGYWSVDLLAGGEASLAFVTAVGSPSGTQFDAEQVIFDYHTYIDTGGLGGAFRLPVSATAGPTLVNDGPGPDQVDSSGLFIGESGNTIEWSVSSTIEDGSTTLFSTFVLTAQSGSLGNIRLYQYLDEDVLGFSDDFFFTRGSLASQNLELFTVDDSEAIGVSHSGALTLGQGLFDADFAGWAAGVYCNPTCMFDEILNGTQAVSGPGVISALLAGAASVHPVVGAGNGPIDVVSVLAWDVDPLATSATIVTTLGGVPEAPPPVDTFFCWGDQFLPPFDVPLTLKRNSKRVIPVKMILEDESGVVLTDADFYPPEPPVINVMYSANGDGSDYTESEDLLPAGHANDDNIFRWDPDEQIWIYNLGTKLHGASGLYKVTAVSGDESSYVIDSESCQGLFERLP